MASEGPLMIYYDRWSALNALITSSIDRYDAVADLPRMETILNLLKSLQAFAKGQFDFFYYGFDYAAKPPRAEKDRGPLLQHWDEFPTQDVLTGILLQIGNDLELIQRAADQRIWAAQQKALEKSDVQDALENADKLAWLALQPAIFYKVIEPPTTVLTYFQKSAEFYSIPYAKVAIIAIPFTCVTKATYQDYLAIPHEVGHYVYRNPTVPVKADMDKLRLSPPVDPVYQRWVKSVFEEMCADIYGCLIGGPVMALDFAGLSLDNSQSDFTISDGQHPNPALRPLIYCEVLAHSVVDQLADGAWHKMGGLLYDHWKRQLDRLHVSDFVIKTSELNGQDQLIKAQPHDIATAMPDRSATISEAQPNSLAAVVPSDTAAAVPNRTTTTEAQPTSLADLVPKIMAAMLKQLSTFIAKGDLMDRWPGWAGMIDSDNVPGELLQMYHKNFDEKLTKGDKYKPPEAKLPEEDLWRKWAVAKNNILKQWPPKEEILSGEVKDQDKMKPNSWGYILFADGWTTGGPSDTNAGHPAV